MDANHVGKRERGEVRWPTTHYRAALRAVLGVTRSADLGFYITKDGVDPDPPEPEAVTMAVEPGPSLLRTVLAERHRQVYRTFRVQFERAARELAAHEGHPTVGTLDVSERQFYRWLRGARPHPDACRVPESMFGHPIARLIGPAETLPAPAADSAGAPDATPGGAVSAAGSGLALVVGWSGGTGECDCGRGGCGHGGVPGRRTGPGCCSRRDWAVGGLQT